MEELSTEHLLFLGHLQKYTTYVVGMEALKILEDD